VTHQKDGVPLTISAATRSLGPSALMGSFPRRDPPTH
jgi:hypothetical protein